MSEKQQQQSGTASIHSHALVMKGFREQYVYSVNTDWGPAAHQALLQALGNWHEHNSQISALPGLAFWWGRSGNNWHLFDASYVIGIVLNALPKLISPGCLRTIIFISALQRGELSIK